MLNYAQAQQYHGFGTLFKVYRNHDGSPELIKDHYIQFSGSTTIIIYQFCRQTKRLEVWGVIQPDSYDYTSYLAFLYTPTDLGLKLTKRKEV